MLRWLSIIAVLAFCSTGSAYAAGIERPQVAPVVSDGGNSPIPIAVAGSTIAWTVFNSSDSISRGFIAYAPTTNAVAVCVSTHTTTATVCDDTTAGIEIAPGGFYTFTDKAKHTFRGRTTGPAATTVLYLKGWILRDRGDFGYIGQPNQ